MADAIRAIAYACKLSIPEVIERIESSRAAGLGPLETFADFQRIAAEQGNELVHAAGIKDLTGRAVLRLPLVPGARS